LVTDPTLDEEGDEVAHFTVCESVVGLVDRRRDPIVRYITELAQEPLPHLID